MQIRPLSQRVSKAMSYNSISFIIPDEMGWTVKLFTGVGTFSRPMSLLMYFITNNFNFIHFAGFTLIIHTL